MIYEQIDSRIKQMREVRRLEKIQGNQKQQKITDKNFCSLVEQVSVFYNTLCFARDNLSFILTDSIEQDTVDLFKNLKNTVQSGYADQEILTNAEKKFKSVQVNTNKEWSKYFVNYTSATRNTLRVLSGIENEKMTIYINRIDAAKSWSTDSKILKNFKEAMDEANSLIQNMNLNEDVTAFLTKMASGKASLLDVNNSVYDWIHVENLEARIKLSFF